MSKFVVSATTDDKYVTGDAKFEYKILDNNNYTIDEFGGVSAKPDYIPQLGETFTVQVTYKNSYGYLVRKTKKFTVKE
jgi:hypothetical protein